MTHREIWCENHTPDTYEMRFTEGGNFSGMGLVEPCSPGGVNPPLEEEFAFQLAAPDDHTSAPGTPVTDWQAWEEGGDQHVVAVIRPNGHVDVERRAEPPRDSPRWGEHSRTATRTSDGPRLGCSRHERAH